MGYVFQGQGQDAEAIVHADLHAAARRLANR
jgi:hypothetical protein